MIQVHRAEILHFIADPEKIVLEESYEHYLDGVLIVERGRVRAVGEYSTLQAEIEDLENVEYFEHPNAILMPGFVDTHIHYPQTEMIAAYGEQLLEWLETYTFPTERQFEDKEHARRISKLFLDELLRAGTTTALVFEGSTCGSSAVFSAR